MWYTAGMNRSPAPGLPLLLAAMLLAVGCTAAAGSGKTPGEAEGGTWRVFAGAGSGGAALQYPAAVALDAGGQVYVVDSRASRVLKLAADGAPLVQWGSGG